MLQRKRDRCKLGLTAWKRIENNNFALISISVYRASMMKARYELVFYHCFSHRLSTCKKNKIKKVHIYIVYNIFISVILTKQSSVARASTILASYHCIAKTSYIFHKRQKCRRKISMLITVIFMINCIHTSRIYAIISSNGSVYKKTYSRAV